MVTLRVPDSDADLDQWRRVRMAVESGRTASVAELRAMQRPGRLLLLAELDGAVVGSGVADRSDRAGRGFLAPRVLPSARRRGVGTTLLRELARHSEAHGHTIASAGVEDPGSLAFAERFGFTEVDRQVEQVRAIGDEPEPAVPAGVRIVSVASDPALWTVAYHSVAAPTFGDMALTSPITVTLDEWGRDWISDPEAMFLALAGDEVIGVAGLILDPDEPDRAEAAYTAVRPPWRGQGVAAALKRTAHAWAARRGLTEVYTWTQRGNAAMRRLNEHLGFHYGLTSITVEAGLPLTR